LATGECLPPLELLGRKKERRNLVARFGWRNSGSGIQRSMSGREQKVHIHWIEGEEMWEQKVPVRVLWLRCVNHMQREKRGGDR
jgi:hypothetical protein